METRPSNLLMAIQRKLSPDGSSVDISEDLKSAKARLMKAKANYLSSYVIMKEIMTVVQSGTASENSDSQYISLMNDALTRAQLQNISRFPHSQENQEIRVLGIKKELISLQDKQKQTICQALQQHYIPELEKSLKEKCRFLYEFYTTSNENSNEALTFAKACQLPLTLEKQVQKAEDLRNALRVKKKENWDRLQKYFKALILELELTRDLLSHEGFRSSFTNNEVKVKWLAAKCEALHLKLSVMRTQILSSTYTTETIDALQKVREHLLQALEDTERKLAKGHESLLVYQSAGPELENLAKQFVQITTEMDNKKWALSQLQHGYQRTESVDV